MINKGAFLFFKKNMCNTSKWETSHWFNWSIWYSQHLINNDDLFYQTESYISHENTSVFNFSRYTNLILHGLFDPLLFFFMCVTLIIWTGLKVKIFLQNWVQSVAAMFKDSKSSKKIIEKRYMNRLVADQDYPRCLNFSSFFFNLFFFFFLTLQLLLNPDFFSATCNPNDFFESKISTNKKLPTLNDSLQIGHSCQSFPQFGAKEHLKGYFLFENN